MLPKRLPMTAIGAEDDAFVWQGTLHSPGRVMENPFELPSHPELVCIYTTPRRPCTGRPRQTNPSQTEGTAEEQSRG